MIDFIIRHYSIFIFVFFLFGNIEHNKNGIELRKLTLKKNKHYSQRIISKKALESKFNYNTLNNIPEEVNSYLYEPSDDTKRDLFECRLQVENIKSKFEDYCNENDIKNTGKEFATYWKDKLRLCYLKYKKTAPVLYFEFQHNDDETYILDSISVFIYAATKSMSVEGEFYDNNAESIKETIIINSSLKDESQILSLNKGGYAIKETFFDLELRILPEKYWKGNFDKNRFLMEVAFQFVRKKDGEVSYVESDPFFIDL